VDGVEVTGTANAYTFSSRDIGPHKVTLTVVKDAKLYSADIVITVEKK